MDQRTALRDEFKTANNKWYDAQRAVRAQKQLKYEAEKAVREAEKAAYLKAKEAEELAKTPYEEEMALCDYLADYLTRTYLVDAAAEKKKREEEAEKKKREAEGVVMMKDEDNPFANMMPVKKNDDNGDYFGKGKGGKAKRNRSNAKSGGGGKSKQAFTLSVDSFEQFGLLGLTPPTSADAVPKSVEELRERKVWYSQQERGSVPTARDIRKENEKNAAKMLSGKGGSGSGGKGRKKNGGGGGEEEALGPGTNGAASAAPLAGQWAARS